MGGIKVLSVCTKLVIKLAKSEVRESVNVKEFVAGRLISLISSELDDRCCKTRPYHLNTKEKNINNT